MLISDDAELKPFTQAALGSLLIGRFGDGPNFFAIRTELQESTGEPTSYMAILSSWLDDQPLPFLCAPVHREPVVLDLGKDWSFDLTIDENQPTFDRRPDTVLIRSEAGVFIRLSDGLRLDIAKGITVKDVADLNLIAAWSAFGILLRQRAVEGLGPRIFVWPQRQGTE